MGRLAVLCVDATDPRGKARRADHHLIADSDATVDDSARHHRARSGQRETSVHRKAQRTFGAARGGPGLCVPQREAQGPYPVSVPRGDGQYRRIRQPGSRDRGTDLCRHLCLPCGIGKVAFGQRHDPLRDSQQIKDRQMFTRLRHHPVIRGDDQQGHVDAARPRQHRVDQTFMPRHIHKSGDRATPQIGIGEAQVDGDAARLFLGQTVGVGARQGLDQRCLAVVDMPCRSDDHSAAIASSRALSSSRQRRSRITAPSRI